MISHLTAEQRKAVDEIAEIRDILSLGIGQTDIALNVWESLRFTAPAQPACTCNATHDGPHDDHR